jgi:dipeptidyl aminopeptidase/acylaminoacyl peptidase
MKNRVIAGVVALLLVAGGVVVGALVFGDDDGSAPATSASSTPDPLAVPDVSVAPSPPMEDVRLGDRERGTRTGSPLDDLPDGVTARADVGQRPEWSPDGRELAFLDGSPLGDVSIVDADTGRTRNVTGGFEHHGFSRSAYLANGDLLLCGPTSGPQPSGERPEAGRFTGVMSVLRAPFDGEPEPLGVPCWEGIAAARSSMRIAWNRSDIDYTDSDLTDRVVNGITEIWTGEIRDVDGRAAIVDARKVLDRDAFGSLAVFEVQAFRPPQERELILTAYEEAEGIDPDGRAVYVERDTAYSGIEPGALDIWRLELEDGSWERVTHFNRYAPYYASNPTVSPDGRTLAFQLSIDGDTEGEGDGILLLDLATTPSAG